MSAHFVWIAGMDTNELAIFWQQNLLTTENRHLPSDVARQLGRAGWLVLSLGNFLSGRHIRLLSSWLFESDGFAAAETVAFKQNAV